MQHQSHCKFMIYSLHGTPVSPIHHPPISQHFAAACPAPTSHLPEIDALASYFIGRKETPSSLNLMAAACYPLDKNFSFRNHSSLAVSLLQTRFSTCVLDPHSHRLGHPSVHNQHCPLSLPKGSFLREQGSVSVCSRQGGSDCSFCGGCLVHCRQPSGIPGLSELDASQQPSTPVLRRKHCQCPLGGQFSF